MDRFLRIITVSQARCFGFILITLCAETVIRGLLSRLRSVLSSWDPATLTDVLHDENRKTSLKQKEYMTILRHALTGMKVRSCLLQPIKLKLMFILRRPDLALLTSFLSLARNAALQGYKHCPSECPGFF